MRTFATISRFFCVLGILGLFVVGCSDKEETREIDFSLSRYSVAFEVGGGITSLTVGTSDSWTASTDAAWLSLSQDGSTLYITAEANNETTDIREAEVTVSTQTYGSETVEVRQEPAASPSISIYYGASSTAIDSEGGSFTAVVKSNYDWTAALAQDIEGWELSYDTTTGKVAVTAGPNSGDTIIGTVEVTSGNEYFTETENFTVTQISRAENPYYQFVGGWDVNSSDCCVNQVWYGAEGAYTSCNISEYSYTDEILTLSDWSLTGIQTDRLVYYPENGTATLPLGYLCGSTYSGYYLFYLYLVAFKEDFTGFSTPEILFTLSDDAESITISGIDDDYPVIGLTGYNLYYGYVTWKNMAYVKAPLTLTKSEGESTYSVDGKSSGFTVIPVSEIPEGVPAHLPKGFVGKISDVIDL